MADTHRQAGLALARQLAAQGQWQRPTADGAEGVRWSGPELVGDDHDWRIVERTVGPGLYSGSSGIALALAAAHAIEADPDLRRTAVASAGSALRGGTRLADEGFLDLAAGSSGIAHAVAWVGSLVGDPALRAGAMELARATAARLPEVTPDPDYLGGTAGAIVALLATRPDDQEVRAATARAAQRIAELARRDLVGIAWPESGGGTGTGLLGLAHGTAGTGLALLAASVNGARDLEEVIAAAWDRDRSWFDRTDSNWPDLRTGAGAPGHAPSMVAWCHGALGVGCARLRWLELRPDSPSRLALLAEVTAAVEATRRQVMTARAALRAGRTTDVSLCHGLTGVTELLLGAADLPGGSDHARAAARVADLILAQREHAGCWPCGLPAGTSDGHPPEPPGLFLGHAGIALGLLRLDARRALPSIAVPRPVPASPGAG